jgi:hypothetical protein
MSKLQEEYSKRLEELVEKYGKSGAALSKAAEEKKAKARREFDQSSAGVTPNLSQTNPEAFVATMNAIYTSLGNALKDAQDTYDVEMKRLGDAHHTTTKLLNEAYMNAVLQQSVTYHRYNQQTNLNLQESASTFMDTLKVNSPRISIIGTIR